MRDLKVTMEQSHTFTSEDINYLVVAALEGGINYWCRKAIIKLDVDKEFFGVAEEDRTNINYASDVIGYDGTLVLYDAESEDKWELTLEKMLKGIQMYCKENEMPLSELIDNHDADTADAIVQYAIFDEIVFG